MITDVVYEEKSQYGGTPDYDGLWKKVIEELFEEFMQFFASDLYEEIDFTETPDFLPREMYQAFIKGKKGRKDADQIVEVALQNGEKKWIAIHIEVQGEYSIDFPERMFRYFYRIYDNYNQHVYAIALLTDERKSNYPDHFHYSFYGTKIEYEYNVYKFIDHTIEELEQLTNPFAFAVIAGKYASKYKRDSDKQYYFKRKLMKQILERYSFQQEKSRTYISALFYFIDYLLRTPVEREPELRKELSKYLKEGGEQEMRAEREESPTLAAIYKMFEEEAEAKGLEKGLERGLEKGMEKGIEKGMEKGMEKGLAEGEAKGEERGIQIAKENVAINLINEGFSDEKTAELSGLELKTVASLRETLEK